MVVQHCSDTDYIVEEDSMGGYVGNPLAAHELLSELLLQ